MTPQEIETWLAEMPDDAARIQVAKWNKDASWAKPWLELDELGEAGRIQKRFTDATEAFEAGLTAFCKAQNIERVWTVGLEAYRATDEGGRLNEALHQLNDETLESA